MSKQSKEILSYFDSYIQTLFELDIAEQKAFDMKIKLDILMNVKYIPGPSMLRRQNAMNFDINPFSQYTLSNFKHMKEFIISTLENPIFDLKFKHNLFKNIHKYYETFENDFIKNYFSEKIMNYLIDYSKSSKSKIAIHTFCDIINYNIHYNDGSLSFINNPDFIVENMFVTQLNSFPNIQLWNTILTCLEYQNYLYIETKYTMNILSWIKAYNERRFGARFEHLDYYEYEKEDEVKMIEEGGNICKSVIEVKQTSAFYRRKHLIAFYYSF
jgi:hypothetical protein